MNWKQKAVIGFAILVLLGFIWFALAALNLAWTPN